MSHHEQHTDGQVHAHISSVKAYVAIFAGLLVLTAVTVGLSYVHLGELNLAIALLIATMKASLVVTFFMHLKYDAKFNALFFLGTLAFIGVFLVYTTNDTSHRALVDGIQGAKIDPLTGEVAPGGREASVEPKHLAGHGEAAAAPAAPGAPAGQEAAAKHGQ